MENINFVLDLKKGRVQPFRDVVLQQFDKNCYNCTITIQNAGTAYDLTGKTIRVQGIKPDLKSILCNTTVVNAKEGTINLQIDEQMTVKAGLLKLQLLIFGANDFLQNSIPFVFIVGSSLNVGEPVVSTDEFLALTETLKTVSDWDRYFSETSGKIEEKYTPRLNELQSSLDENAKKNLINIKFPPKNLVGAKGDGVTDDTIAINNIINYVNNNKLDGIYIPQSVGSYMIKATGDSDIFPAGTRDGGIIIDKPIEIVIHKDATLEAITGNKVGYSILNIKNTTNVKISGGNIKGERATHIGTSGEFGFGVNILSSTNIILEDISISNCWGDGIFIGYISGYVIKNNNITVRNVRCDNNRRQGLSVTEGSNIFILNSCFTNTNGTAPESGIDIEPEVIKSENIVIDGCFFNGNYSADIIVGGGIGVKATNITNNIIRNGKNSIILTATDKVENINISNNTIIDYKISGINISKACNCNINNNIIQTSKDNSMGGVLIKNCTETSIFNNRFNITSLIGAGSSIVYDGASSSRLSIYNNAIVGGYIGIYLAQKSTDCSISNNIIRDCILYGMWLNVDNCIIENNQINNIGNIGIKIQDANYSKIYGNKISLVGKDSYPDMPHISVTTSTSSYYSSNIFDSVNNGQKSLKITTSPTKNYISNNLSVYTTTPFMVDASNVLYNNLTAQ